MSLHKMIDGKIRMIQATVTIPAIKVIVKDLDYRNFYDRYKQFKEYAALASVEGTDSEPLSKSDRDLLRINKLDYSSYGNRVELYEEMIGVEYNHLTESEINNQIIETKIRIEKFKKEYAKKKFQQAHLIGMTIDSFNTRFKEDSLGVHHIFIDEGGYMSLIKAYGLCRENIPISILGDPLQLPPVSEMSGKITENGTYEPVMLYDMSAFYLEILFEEGYEGLKRAYFNKLEPTYNTIPKVDLLQTHRFGDKLANILNKYVYKNGFSSAIGDGGFILESINAVNKTNPPGNRINPAEANAIRLLLEGSLDDSIAILTPYKKQVTHLQEQLKGLIDPNNIMSIHRSQGQEWDTVIMSVVDHQSKGAYGMHFTDSTNKVGVKIVNTSVSRAKRKLIIVGHEWFWTQQQNQLIGELFRSAEKLELNE